VVVKVPAFLHMEALDAEKNSTSARVSPSDNDVVCNQELQGIGLLIATPVGGLAQ
jgi:hypothetical protein